MTYATPAEIAVLLGVTFDTAQTAQCQAFLDDVEEQILERIPDLAARITAGTVTETAVKRVERRAVRRVMLNPDGKDNERIEDYSFGRNDSVAESEVFITDEEWAWLIPQVSPGEAFSIKTAGTIRTYDPEEWGR